MNIDGEYPMDLQTTVDLLIINDFLNLNIKCLQNIFMIPVHHVYLSLCQQNFVLHAFQPSHQPERNN